MIKQNRYAYLYRNLFVIINYPSVFVTTNPVLYVSILVLYVFLHGKF